MIQRLFLSFFRAQIPLWLGLLLVGLMLIIGIGGGFASALMITRPAVAGGGLNETFMLTHASVTECPEAPEVCQEFAVFWDVWNLARKDFVEPEAVVPDQMIEGAVNGMLDSMGDEGHTRFLSADDARRWLESMNASFEGIGAYIDVRDGQTVIVAPIEGSPAEAAGIRSGDIILEVDGVETTGWTVEELMINVRGPKGTTVVLTVLHPGERAPVDIAVQRDEVTIPSVSWTMLPDNLAFVRLDSFSQRAAEEMERALTEAQAEGAQAIILDLRDNHGGLVKEAMGIASQFLPEGSTVYLEENRDGERIAAQTTREGVAQDIPMVVLVNINTASSAEIISGALQDAERAQVLGVQTVGTGTVLSQYRLEGGARLLLGTSQWLTPNGRVIRNQGITPDVEVLLPLGALQLTPSAASELSPQELQESEDTQLLEAMEQLEHIAQQ